MTWVEWEMAGAPGWREWVKVRTNVCARRVGSLVRHHDCPRRG